MILTKLFIILITILLILEMNKYFKNKFNPIIEGAATMASTSASGAGTASVAGPIASGAGTIPSVAGPGTSASASAGAANTMQYTDPGLGKDPVYLSTLNASNITYLKNQVDELVGLKQQLNDLSAKVAQNSTALTQLSTQMSDTANKALGRSPTSTAPIPQATGLN
jgi:hypothetical protein